MSERLTWEKERRVYAQIRGIENDGGNSNATREFWPLSNHSGGDGRFPTCGARQSVLKRFDMRTARSIMGSSSSISTLSTSVSSTSSSREATPASSTPVFRAKLRRPISWSSTGPDEVFSPVKKSQAGPEVIDCFSPEKKASLVQEDSGIMTTPLVKARMDVAVRGNAVGSNKVDDIAKGEPSKFVDEYHPQHIWDSEEEELKAKEEATKECTTCSR